MELTLRVQPHHAYAYIIHAFSGEDDDGEFGILLRQGGFSTLSAMVGGVDVTKDHLERRFDVDWLNKTREALQDMKFSPIPKVSAFGLGGAEYQLTVDDEEGASVQFEWWRELPKDWRQLAPIVEFLLEKSGEQDEDDPYCRCGLET